MLTPVLVLLLFTVLGRVVRMGRKRRGVGVRRRQSLLITVGTCVLRDVVVQT